MANYRQLFKKYYGLEFGNNYQIHHIDFNHENDDISNLLLLPRWIHKEYHEAIKDLPRLTNYPLVGTISLRPIGWANADTNYERECIRRFWKALDACRDWVDYKRYLDGEIPNIHNIRLLSDDEWHLLGEKYV